jgi:hypothetical protein
VAEARTAVRTHASHRTRAISPSPLLSFGIALAGVCGALSVLAGIFDPDYFWHLATGRLIVERGAIPTSDPFSFTWNGEPWIPDQWLSDVLIHAVVSWLGPTAGLLIFGAIAASAVVLIGVGLRRSAVGYPAILAVGLLVTAAILPQITMRPQVLSLPLVGLVVLSLLSATPVRSRHLLGLPVLFLVWANLHGFYVVGLGVGFVYLVATWLGQTPMSPRRGLVLAVGVASLAASAITPSGPAGIFYSLSFADTSDWGARNIAEWQSPNFHDPQFLPFLLLIVALLAVGGRGSGWLRVLAFGGVALGLIAIRSVALAALMAMPTLAFGVDRLLSALRRPGQPRDPGRGWIELAAAVVVAVVAASFAVTRADGIPQPSPDRFPVGGVAYLATHHPDARVLASYGWGGYVLNELYARGGRVFVDGRMHKYAPGVIEDYERIVTADQGWVELVHEYDVDALLLNADMPLARGPASAAGWCEAVSDERYVLLLRSCP